MDKEFLICEVTGKRCYSQKNATIAIKFAKKQKGGAGTKPNRSYYCNLCGYFHLTSKRDLSHKHKPLKEIYKN